MKAFRVSIGIALLFLGPRDSRWWWWGPAPRPCHLYLRERPSTLVYRRLGGSQDRSGRTENLVPTGIRSRNVQSVAQSLYRLSYRAGEYLVHL